MLALKNFYVLGLGLEKKVLALAWPWPRKIFMSLALALRKKVLALAS